MTSEKFNQILEETLEKCKNTLGVKAEEYATSDRLHNFKVAAELQNCTPMTALAGMMAKHTVSVYDLIGRAEYGVDVPLELWEEKIGDHINYLILLSAMIRENLEKKENEKTTEILYAAPGAMEDVREMSVGFSGCIPEGEFLNDTCIDN